MRAAMPTLVGNVTPGGHFTWHECECHSTPPVPVPPEYQDNARAVCRELERIRRVCGNKELTVTRIYSTKAHNDSIPGAAKASQHLTANAADILPPVEGMTGNDLGRVVQMLAHEPESRIRYIKVYPPPDTHVHFDLRKRSTLLVEGL
jgi:hypothetical protein